MLSYRLEPIVDLQKENVFGYELLCGETCCPQYTLKDWLRFYAELSKSLPNILQGLPVNKALFVNLDSEHILNDSIFYGFYRPAITPFRKRLVIEWTEAPFPENLRPNILSRLELMKSEGFHIAVDDVGSGVDGVQRVLDCLPAFAKLDGTYILNSRDKPKSVRHKELYTVTKQLKSSSKIIVEHIETQSDFDTATQSGAHYGQGYRWPSTRHVLTA